MGEGLREVADEPPSTRVVLLGKEPDVVGETGEAVEQRSSFSGTALKDEVVGEPEAAWQERAFATRQTVDLAEAVARVAADESVLAQLPLDRRDRAHHARVARRRNPTSGIIRRLASSSRRP